MDLDFGVGSKNTKFSQFSTMRVFCLARLWGIGNEEDDSSAGDESTHSPPVADHRSRHCVQMARQRRKRTRAQPATAQEVEGDSASRFDVPDFRNF